MGKIEDIRAAYNQRGFTLIELLIGIAIIGMIMAALIPLMQQREPGYERKQFTARLNSLMQIAWQQAIITHAVHRILFNFNTRTASIEKDITTSPTAKKLEFEPVKGSEAQISWPETFIIQQFIIEGFDEMRRPGGKAETAWFYLIPDGMTQQVTINGIDKEEMIEGKPSRFGLVSNPYTAQFKAYDAFQK